MWLSGGFKWSSVGVVVSLAPNGFDTSLAVTTPSVPDGPRECCMAVMQSPGLQDRKTHFLLLNVPRILGTNLPILLSLVSSSAWLSPVPVLPASSFLQKTSKRL